MFKKIQDHFKKPKGLIGRLVGKQMAMENKALNKWTIKQLKIRPGKKILEVGYGPGYAMDFILSRYKNVHVDGIDISRTMKDEASHRLNPETSSGEAHLQVGDIAESPLQTDHYNVVFTVNNFTLWKNRRKGLRNIYSGMAPRGKIVITIQPRQEDARENKVNAFAKEIQDDLSAAGFERIVTQYKRMSPETAVCVTAIKP